MKFKTSRYKRSFYQHLKLDKECMEYIKMVNYFQEKAQTEKEGVKTDERY